MLGYYSSRLDTTVVQVTVSVLIVDVPSIFPVRQDVRREGDKRCPDATNVELTLGRTGDARIAERFTVNRTGHFTLLKRRAMKGWRVESFDYGDMSILSSLRR